MRKRLLLIAALMLTGIGAQAQTQFPPLQAWESAVSKGDRTALAKLYSSNPEPSTLADKIPVPLKDELSFWTGIKPGMTEFKPRLLDLTTPNGNTEIRVRISATINGAHHCCPAIK